MNIAVTGASGHLGRLIVQSLLNHSIAPANITALVRSPEKVADLAARGINVVQADYEDPASLDKALHGMDRLVLVSSSAFHDAVPHHVNVIDAAKKNNVGLVAFTSLLNVESSSITPLAPDSRETEQYLRDSGLDWVMLRNGSYWENYAANVEIAQHTGAMFGAAGNAVVSGSARKDYAEAAATVVAEDGHAGKAYELAGQPGLTYEEIAEGIGRIVGKPVVYQDASVADYRSQLLEFGVPEGEADILATLDEQIARGDMESASTDLERLIGRPATSLEDALRTS